MLDSMKRITPLLLLWLAAVACSLDAQTYSIDSKATKYAIVLEHVPEVGPASLDITFFRTVDPVKEEAFVRMQAEEAAKRIPAGVDMFVNLFSQLPGQREKTVLFPDGSRFLLYRAKDKTLYSQKTDPQFNKQ